MQTASVVEADDVLVDVGSSLHGIVIAMLPQALHFQVQEESFHDGVVMAIAFSAHAGDQAVLLQYLAMSVAGG